MLSWQLGRQLSGGGLSGVNCSALEMSAVISRRFGMELSTEYRGENVWGILLGMFRGFLRGEGFSGENIWGREKS